jgi:hypothetical protein
MVNPERYIIRVSFFREKTIVTEIKGFMRMKGSKTWTAKASAFPAASLLERSGLVRLCRVMEIPFQRGYREL